MTHKMTPDEKIFYLAHQIDHPPAEGPTVIHCAYCGGETVEGEMFCCDTIIRALSAIADARDKFGYRS